MNPKDFNALTTFWRDFLYSARSICRNPSFAVTAILTLALAIGGDTAMFTVIHAVLLKPLQYRDPEKLVKISGGATPSRFEELRSSATSFSGIAASTEVENLTLTGAFEPEVLRAARVSANYLGILNVDPVLGRAFLPEEDAPGGTGVVMLSTALWQRRFSRDPLVIGKTIALGSMPYTVVGVLPPGFQFPFRNVDIWLPRPAEWSLMPPKSRPLSPFLNIFGRLKPGISLAQANAEAASIHHRYALAHPAMLDAKSKSPVEITPMKEELVSGVRTMLWMLFGAVCFVLVIACANVANLLLVRAGSRKREFAVRSALGATRGRLVRQLLAENLLLSFAAGLLGVWLATWTVKAIPSITAFELPRASEIHLDGTVLGFALALSMVTGILFGLAPSFSASKLDLATVLRARVESAGPVVGARLLGWFRIRSILVVAQIALSVVLLIGAALLMQSLVHLRNDNVGFNSSNLLTMRISLPLSRYDTDEKRNSFFDECVRRVAAVPGVRDATAAMFLPMSGFVGTPAQDANKAPLRLNERPIITLQVVTPNYFRTLQIPMRRGRDFNEQDTATSRRVTVIDEALARRFWPAYPAGQSPIGQRLLIGGLKALPAEIIGIAAKVHQNVENSAWPETAYESFAQNAQPSAMLAIRTSGNPGGFTSAIREKVRALDRDQPISEVETMQDLVDDEMGERGLVVALLGAFAGVSLLLAVIGIYGLIAYSAIQRTHEIGVRRAVGAQHADILQLIVGQGLGLAVTGIVMGLAGAYGLTRVLSHALFQVSATDPVTFVVIAVTFLVVALGASAIPAHYATRIDPMQALRVE